MSGNVSDSIYLQLQSDLHEFCSGISPASTIAHSRLLQIAESPDAAVWSSMLSAIRGARSAHHLAIAAQLLALRVKNMWFQSIADGDRIPFADALFSAYSAASPLLWHSTVLGSSSKSACTACEQLWALILIRCPASYARDSICAFMGRSKLFDADTTSWTNAECFANAPSVCVSLLSACLELNQATSFQDEARFFEMGNALTTLTVDTLRRMTSWFSLFASERIETIQLIMQPLIRLLKGSTSVDISLGLLREINILPILIHNVDFAAQIVSDCLLQFCQAPPSFSSVPKFLMFSKMIQALLESLTEFVSCGASSYPPHAQRFQAISDLMNLCIRLTGLARLISASSSALNADAEEVCECNKLTSISIVRLAAQIGETDTERICGIADDGGDLELVNHSFVHLMVELTAHPDFDVVEECLEFWHCLQGIERSERAAWTLQPVLILVCRALISKLAIACPFRAIRGFPSASALRVIETLDEEPLQSDTDLILKRRNICDTIAVIAPMVLIDLLREFYTLLRSSLVAIMSSNQQWSTLESVAVAFRACEPAVRQHLTFVSPSAETEDEVSFWVCQILAFFVEFLLNTVSKTQIPSDSLIQCINTACPQLHHQCPFLQTASLTHQTARVPPVLILSIVSLLASFSKWWARNCPLLPVNAAILYSMCAYSEASHVARISAQEVKNCDKSASAEHAVSKLWAHVIIHLNLEIMELVASSDFASTESDSELIQYSNQCLIVLWNRTCICLARELSDCGVWAEESSSAQSNDFLLWLFARAHSLLQRVAMVASVSPQKCQVIIPITFAQEIGVFTSGGVHQSAFSSSRSTGDSTSFKLNLSPSIIVEALSGMLAAAPQPRFCNVRPAFGPLHLFFNNCLVAVQSNQLTFPAESIFPSALAHSSHLNQSQCLQALTIAIQCAAALIRPWVGALSSDDQTDRNVEADYQAAVSYLEPTLPLWATLCRLNTDPIILSSFVSLAVVSCRTLCDVRLIHPTLSVALSNTDFVLQLIENRISSQQPISSMVLNLNVLLDCIAELLDCIALASSEHEASLHSSLRSLSIGFVASLLARALNLSAKINSSECFRSTVAACMHLTSVLVTALADCIGASHEATDIVSGLQTLSTECVPMTCLSIRCWPGDTALLVRVFALWSSNIRIPRDLQVSIRMRHSVALLPPAVTAFVDQLAASVCQSVTHSALRAIAIDLPQVGTVIAELSSVWLEASSLPASNWSDWWISWLTEHCTALGLVADECINIVVPVAIRRVGEGRLRAWREYVLALSHVLRKSANFNSLE